LATPSDLDSVVDTSATLAAAANPEVAATFTEALNAAKRLQRSVVEVPLRLTVTTGKPNPHAAIGTRLPQEVPGVIKGRGDEVVFYPADEFLRPFALSSEQAAHLPHDTLLIARATKKQMDFSLPDGAVERSPVYTLNNSGPREARHTFVGVIDVVAGEPFVRDLVPPARLASLPATQPDGTPWRQGTIVDVEVNNGEAAVSRTVAAAGTPKARTWLVAGNAGLDAIFPDAAVAEAGAIEKAAATSLADPSLVDMTKKPFFAIDNPGSTDIDQAMLLERRSDGGYTISYALADAAHYITPDKALFDEAMARGVSCYLPGLSIPMLPSVLSEGVISLNAHEDHRAMVIVINLDKDGVVDQPAQVLRAKIHSQAQLTYEGVSAELEGHGKIATDEHQKPVPQAVRAQLALFAEIGAQRMQEAKARGVVEPDRRVMQIGQDEGRFFLRDRKDNIASKLNAEFSILANVGGAEQLLSSTVPGLYLPGIFKVHAEPADGVYRALARQADVFARTHQLPETWTWKPQQESLSTWVDRLKALPTSQHEQRLSQVLQLAAVRINVASEFQAAPGTHSGLKVDHYGRFSAPMREQVGVVSHAIVFAKQAVEGAVTSGAITAVQAQALWAPVLLGALVHPDKIPEGRRQLAADAQALLSASSADAPVLARRLAERALAQAPELTAEERRLVDNVVNKAVSAGNSGKMRQGQVDGAARKLLFDDLFASDLGGNALGNPAAPRRTATITSVTPAKVYVQLHDPDIEVRLGMDDLRRHCPEARFHLADEGCALVSDHPAAGAVSRLVIGAEVQLQATHHDGDRLHFGIVE
jgi:exoribonuclease R